MEPHRDILQGSILEAIGEAIVNAANEVPAGVAAWEEV